MSKFLKIVVNICITCFVLIGIALVVPQFLDITTVIVDDNVTESNVSMGSVVYGRKVDLADLGVGDKLLRSTNTTCYVSEITEADSKTGSYTVEGTDGAEEVTLRNTAEKAYIVIPVIGYASIAMQTFEGRIILGLILAFLVILFILSEIWKKSSDDEEDEEDEEADAEDDAEVVEEPKKKKRSRKKKGDSSEETEEEAANKETSENAESDKEESGEAESDKTEEADADKETAPAELILENVAEESDGAAQEAATLSDEELKALEDAISDGGEGSKNRESDDAQKTDKDLEKDTSDAISAKTVTDDAAETDAETIKDAEVEADAETITEAATEANEETVEESKTDAENVTEEEAETDTETVTGEKTESDAETAAEEKTETDPEAEAEAQTVTDTETTAEAVAESETELSDKEESETENADEDKSEPAVDMEEPMKEVKPDPMASFENAIIQAGESAEAAQSEALQAADAQAPVVFEPLPSEKVMDEEESTDGSKGLAIPALTAEELLEKAKAAGEEPKVIDNPDLGITLIDYSDIL